MKLRGRIVDTETDNGIAHTFVSVLDAHSEKVLCVSLTDEKGRFVFEHLSDTHYKLLIIKNDYISSKFSLDVHDENEIVLSITRFGVKRVSLKNFENYLQIFSSFLLEILLFLSFILEIVLGYSLGWTKAIPFIVITFINLLLWIHLLKHRRTS